MRLKVRIDANSGDVIVEKEESTLPAPVPPQKRVLVPELKNVSSKEVDEVRRIIEVTAEMFSLKPDWILGQGRVAYVSFARHIAMWLVRRRTVLSMTQIGRAFDRHHTTVIAAIYKVEASDAIEQGLIARLEAKLDALKPKASVLETTVPEVVINHDNGD